MTDKHIAARSTSAVPQPIRQTTWLMFAGAVVGAVSALVLFLTKGGLRDVLRDDNPAKTASEIDSMVDMAVATGLVFGAFFSALYVVLAIQIGRARQWARITTIVIAVVGVVIAVSIVVQQPLQELSTANAVVMTISGVLDLAILVLLQQRPSRAFFSGRATAAPAVSPS